MTVEDRIAIDLPLHIKSALFRAAWRAQGRSDAIKAMADTPMTLEQLQTEIQELENTLSDPTRVWGSMELNTSPRLYREGYWAGLQEVLSIILGRTPGDEPSYPTLAPVVSEE